MTRIRAFSTCFKPTDFLVGGCLVDEYLEHHDFFTNILKILKNSIEDYSKNDNNDDWFPLLSHTGTFYRFF